MPTWNHTLLAAVILIFSTHTLAAAATNSIPQNINTHESSEIITESEAFEGLHQEKLQEVAEADAERSGDSSPTNGTNGYSWDIDWDNGLQYQLEKEHPFWAVFYFNQDDKSTKLDGKIGLKLDINAALYDESYSIPPIDNTTYIRRARLYTAGYFFYLVPAFYKVGLEIADGKFFVRDAFLWMDDIPYVKTLKFGHFKTPSTLDNMISSRDRTFMESSAPVEAFSQGIKFGLQISDTLQSRHGTWAVGFFGNGDESDTSDASDANGRLVWRGTWMTGDNRTDASLIHAGYSGSFIYSGSESVHYRSRPETYIGHRLVDTGKFDAKDSYINGLEFAYAKSSLLLKSEAIISNVQTENDTLNFYGAYGTCAFILTGENHPYIHDRGIFGQISPRKPFSFRTGGRGAVELAMRYSYIDLTDGDIDGGRMMTTTAGINWYLSKTLTVRLNSGYSDIKGGETPGNVFITQTQISLNF